MTPRVRVRLALIVAALVLGLGVLAVIVMRDDASSAGTSLVGANESPAALVAVAAKAPPRALPRGLPQATLVVTVVAPVCFSARRRSMRGLPFLLGDVGDRWRALLFGAPPSLL